jgi:UPF0176 protein
LIRVAALYQFTRFDDPAALTSPLRAACESAQIKGTLLLSREGINGTIAGTPGRLAAVLSHIRALPGCAQLDVKFSDAPAMPFGKLKVRVKREIVTMGEPDIDPLLSVGTYVDLADWNALIADPDTIVIDTRNDYEVAIGTFAGAVDPATPSFRDFPAWFRAHRAELLEGKTKAPISSPQRQSRAPQGRPPPKARRSQGPRPPALAPSPARAASAPLRPER